MSAPVTLSGLSLSATLPAPDSDPDLNSDSDSDYDYDLLESYSRENRDGIFVYSRSVFPKKDFDFINVPRISLNEAATYASGNLRLYVPWCGPSPQPLMPETLDEMKSDAQFILLTDSADTFGTLLNSRCHIKHKFFLVKGSADQCTCYFLRLLKREWRIPIVALVDYDPASLKLLSFYETWMPEEMPCRFSDVELDIKWLGIRRIHVNFAEDPLNAEVIKSGVFADMDDDDLETAKGLLDENFVNKSEERVAEVKRMIKHKLITIVIALHFVFIVDTYLPELINSKRWI
jgi:hypothetical protein